jgi:hypothetical protein
VRVPSASAVGESDRSAAVEAVERAVALNLLDYARALAAVAPESRAESIGCAGGVAAFMGPGSPLTTVKGAGPDISEWEIDAAEALFRRRHAGASVFELAPWVSGASIERLSRRGYGVTGSEDVVVRHPAYDAPLPAPRVAPPEASHRVMPPVASHRVVPVESVAWPDLMLRMNQAEDAPGWTALTRASAVLRAAMRFGVLDDVGTWVGCAEIFPTGTVALFANDATLESARGRGAQTAAIQHRLRIAAAHAFPLLAAEVAPDSTSERNYLRSGFQLAYARTVYSRTLV